MFKGMAMHCKEAGSMCESVASPLAMCGHLLESVGTGYEGMTTCLKVWVRYRKFYEFPTISHQVNILFQFYIFFNNLNLLFP